MKPPKFTRSPQFKATAENLLKVADLLDGTTSYEDESDLTIKRYAQKIRFREELEVKVRNSVVVWPVEYTHTFWDADESL